MGFSSIILVGCEYDYLLKCHGNGNYRPQHFYEGEPSIGFEPFDFDLALKLHLGLREQSHWTLRLAQSQGVKIVNANPTSYLDIFHRVPLSDMLDDRGIE